MGTRSRQAFCGGRVYRRGMCERRRGAVQTNCGAKCGGECASCKRVVLRGMALFKRLELSGFKSFAKAARFDFEAPIVAIVGPNGSGKSNVVEAIRWVLGEQSFKSLRGHRGEDLIFNGTSSSPRLSKAAVLAVFDNSKKHFPVDFGEVAIGRRVYR